jgi:hypothetical protein
MIWGSTHNAYKNLVIHIIRLQEASFEAYGSASTSIRGISEALRRGIDTSRVYGTQPCCGGVRGPRYRFSLECFVLLPSLLPESRTDINLEMSDVSGSTHSGFLRPCPTRVVGSLKTRTKVRLYKSSFLFPPSTNRTPWSLYPPVCI